MKNGDIIEVHINGTTSDGSGVGRFEGQAVFVAGTAPGERVRVRVQKVSKSFAVGSAVKILAASDCRIPADCSCYGRCGGCCFRHISYDEECRIKRGIVADAMRRIGGIDVPVGELLRGESEGYRNKAQYPIDKNGRVGFFAVRSHEIVPCDGCRLQPPVFTEITKIFELFVRQFGISVYSEQSCKGLLRHLYIRSSSAGDIMVTVVINGGTLPHSDALISVLREALGERFRSFVLNINRERTNVILGRECRTLYGEGYITDVLCGITLRVSPLSFSQVNHDMAEQLYRKAAEYAAPEGKTVIDLYCGTGAIGLSLAGRAKSVIGVEIVPKAVEDAIANAAENNIDNIRFICADAAAAARTLRDEGVKSDVVIVDPPRKGCDGELLSIIAKGFCPHRVVYVSCNPATLARDCAALSALGYRVDAVTPFDLFPRTAHVECVVLLTKVHK